MAVLRRSNIFLSLKILIRTYLMGLVFNLPGLENYPVMEEKIYERFLRGRVPVPPDYLVRCVRRAVFLY
jgi:hypothetical protein